MLNGGILIPFEDLRAFLDYLEEKDQLSRISRGVDDKSYEVSAILDILAKKRGKAVVFEKLGNTKMPLCSNVLGSHKRLAMALETTEHDLFSEWKKRKMSNWPVPQIVSDGPCKESVIRKEDIDLSKYPILKWNPLDGGPYITLGVLISKHPETNDRNAGIYRLMVQRKNQLGVNTLPRKHITVHYNKAETNDEPLEVAVAIGLDPAIILAAATRLKLGEDELAFAGALRNEPVKLVRCETINVEVPASAEIVIEGKMPPRTRAMEGPFGEYTGYYGIAQEMPIIEIEAITQRANPIYQATYTGKPPKEEHVMTAVCGPEGDRPPRGWHTLTYHAYRFISGINRRLKQEPIRLPNASIKNVIRQWKEYGLE
jgi:4-hydroxy-3-polyprenylbenzoate decarboxylase